MARWSTTVVMAGGVALGSVTCAPRMAGPIEHPHPERLAWADDVDWEAARDEVAAVLREYVAIDTSNPPGREEAGAVFLEDLLKREGFEVARMPFAPGRDNLVARLKADNPQEAPLCLMHHIDVVPAEVDKWTQPPFAGLMDDEGWIWGRGTLDMKSVGVVEVMSAVWLARLKVPLRRDVILLAVGDEEVDNLGVKDLAANHWADIGCSHVLNEGGMGVRGALFDDLTTIAISYTEKGALWLKMIAEGEPGHGSTPLDDSAPVRLMAALKAVQARKAEPKLSDELYSLLQAIGERVGGIEGAVLKSKGLTNALAVGRLMDHPLSRAMITDTVNVTGFGGAGEPNVVPSEVWAHLDIRMLPGTRSADMLAEMRALTAHVPGIRFEVLQDLEAAVSSVDDPVYAAIARNLQAEFPDAAVGPLVMPGTTDSQVLRPLGVQAYGLAPFVMDQELLRGMHGHDERIHVDNLANGLRVMLRIVLDVAAARGPSSMASGAAPGDVEG